MSLSKLILTAFALLFSCISFSQAICGFDNVHGRRMKEDPVYRQQMINYESNLNKYIQSHGNLQHSKKGPTVLGGALYNIPVVVHVVNTGGAVGSIYNPTDAQIQGAINYLNQVYNGSYPGLEGVKDLQIQFVLAQRDPNCNPTNGINRIDGSGIAGYSAGGVNVSTSLGTDEINVKNLIRWDPTQYYNIWVVDKIDGNDGTSGTFIAGFAYFPGGNPNYDGTIMLATQMVSGQKTLPHEIGHAFNLYHPFEGSPDKNTCPANSNCNTDGDQICDTDPITYNQLGGNISFTCRTGTTNPCTGTLYTINTENNFMNYTSCYDLFTADQKTRMLASAVSPARLSLSNSFGGTPPNTGTTTCTPKINFELDNDQVTELTSTTSGCRSYTDYTYNMVIGNSPSITATATLNVASGTATEGLDFDITTNGNFVTPSKTLTFPSGSNSSQSFTIRIYDDASVESAESFTLNFTVNNGGGNAVVGDGRPTLTIKINDNDIAPYGPTNVTKTLGTNLATLQSPFAAANAKQKAQILYSAAELTSAGISAGNIIGLAFDIVKASGVAFVYNGLTIKIGQTTNTAIYNGTTFFPLSDAGFTTAYSSNYTTSNGWNNFTFSTPFVWDGTSNVVVEVCYDNGVSTDANDGCLSYTDGNASSNYVFKSINCNTAYSGLISQYGSGLKPMIQFVYADAGTQVQTILNSSKQEYLGPNADIYFYDQSNKKLMARIQNQSAFDYGCTQVVIDRSGTNATAFWNNNVANYIMDKTFRVLPTTNNASGNYLITLYYTQAEVNGWQTATGQNISNIQLVKTANQVSLVTPANPTGAGTIVTGNPAITTLGTNTALTYNFTTGFSGFGAGIIGSSTLPIELLSFNAELKDNNVLLDWSTTSEEATKEFDIERAYDAQHFIKIGSVPAAGSSSTIHAYSFTDPDISQEKNYYRLRQIDIDGKSAYSKVILIRNSFKYPFAVLNNPFSNALDIQFGEAVKGNAQIRLLDITGRELFTNRSEATGLTRIHIDLSQQHISAGVYLLEVSFNNEKHIERVVKQ